MSHPSSPARTLPVAVRVAANQLRRRVSGGLALAALLAARAAAADEVTVLSPVTVNGDASPYHAESTSSATRTETRLHDVPQSISIVTRELVRDQAAQGVGDAMRYLPGVSTAQGEANRDTVILRGNASTADFYLNGLRDDVQYFRDLYNVERVEVLKGPNAMIFGRGGGGGVVNRVTRQADWRQVRELSLQTGSWQDRRVAADVGQGLSEQLAGRMTGVYEYADSFRHGVRYERFGVNPTLAWRAGARTRVVLGYEHFEDRRTADRGIPSLDGRPYAVDSATFFGDPKRSVSRAEVDLITAEVEHHFQSGLLLRNQTLYGDYNKFYQNVYPGAVDSTASTVAISAYNADTRRQNVFNQTDLVKTLHGRWQHTLMGGVEIGRQHNVAQRHTGFFAAGPDVSIDGKTYNAPLSDPTINAPITFSRSGNDADNDGVTTLAAVYLQDQIEFTPQWQALVGLRYDYFNIDFDDRRPAPTGAGNLESRDGLLSPRLGLVYKPIEPLSTYLSYAVTQLPRAGEQLSSMTAANQALKPEHYRNLELGAKWDVTRQLAITAAIYRQDRKDVAVADTAPGAPAGQLMLVDGQRIHGLELEISGNLTERWRVIGGYALQDGQISGDQSASVRSGARLAQVPRHSFSLWNRYDLTPRWGAGLGLVSRGAMLAATENVATPASNVWLPGYARVDGAVYCRLSPQLSLQLNVENLLNRDYTLNAHNNNNISPGAPLSFKVGLNARF